MPETHNGICAGKQNEPRDRTTQQASSHMENFSSAQNSVTNSGMWWDGLWFSLYSTQMLFGKTLDMPPWDCVQCFQNLLIHSSCTYLQEATFLAYPQADSICTDSVQVQALLSKCFYAEKQVSKSTLSISTPSPWYQMLLPSKIQHSNISFSSEWPGPTQNSAQELPIATWHGSSFAKKILRI